MTQQLSNDFDFGQIMENLNNKVDMDWENIKNKPETIAKILTILGFQVGGGVQI